MSKVSLFLIISIITTLIIGGVIEVRMHPDKVSSLSGQIVQHISDKEWRTPLQHHWTRLKRGIQLYIARNPKEKFEVSLEHVREDKKVIEAAIEESNPLVFDKVAHLLHSLDRAQEYQERLSDEEIVETIHDIEEDMGDLIYRIEELRSEYEQHQDTLSSVVARIKGMIDVAEEEEREENNIQQKITPIPLRF